MKEARGVLGFTGPTTVTQGDELQIVNLTNPDKVGPHTFSLVNRAALPKTEPARQRCSVPRRICGAIARWHGAEGEAPPTVNPARAGQPGWDAAGSTTRRGDSWFSAEQGDAFTQQLTAAPGTLHFICAIHPWMQGRVDVVAPPAL